MEFVSFLQVHRYWRKLLENIYAPYDVQDKIRFSRIFSARDIQICNLRKAVNNASQTKKNVDLCTNQVFTEESAILRVTVQRNLRITEILKRYNLYFMINALVYLEFRILCFAEGISVQFRIQHFLKIKTFILLQVKHYVTFFHRKR